jgi:uncharacterized Zn-binding protein involved in type VI secretion
MSQPKPSQPIATEGDRVVALDTHVVLVASPGGPVPTPTPFPFSGPLTEHLGRSVHVDGAPAAVEGSVAHNRPVHVPVGGPFQKPPTNRATVQRGSATVFADNKAVARNGDPALSCNDPSDAPTGHVVATGSVYAG